MKCGVSCSFSCVSELVQMAREYYGVLARERETGSRDVSDLLLGSSVVTVEQFNRRYQRYWQQATCRGAQMPIGSLTHTSEQSLLESIARLHIGQSEGCQPEPAHLAGSPWRYGPTGRSPCQTPLGKMVCTTTYVNANLLHDLINGRSCTGMLHILNQTPIDWFSKQQKLVQT